MSEHRTLRDAVWARAWGGALTTPQLVVALRLVEHFPRIFPGEKTLSRWTRLSERAIRDALHALETARLISINRTPGRANTYAFLDASGAPIIVPELGPTPAPAAAPPRQDVPDPPAPAAAPTPAPAAAEADPEKQDLKQTIQAGGRPVLIYKFPKSWKPKAPRHRDEGALLGLTPDDVKRRAFECRHKDYPHGFSDPDDQFSRELSWAAREKETRTFQAQRKANPHGFDENPGARRGPGDPRPDPVFGRKRAG